MQKLNRTTYPSEKLPIKILQFGGGNFLRGFIDFFIDKYNKETNSKIGISVVKVTPKGDYADWRSQDGLYHVFTQGMLKGKQISETYLITCISDIINCYQEWEKFILSAQNREIDFIVSNTTESGLQLSKNDLSPGKTPVSFPAKLTYWLHQRYNNLGQTSAPGCIIIPCELLDENGKILKSLILKQAEIWGLNDDFKNWIQNKNIFCNTLVDRIVPGIHSDDLPEYWQEIGYEDHLITGGEPYHLFVIEAPEIVESKLPLYKAGLNVIFTDDLQPYRQKKVRILNGAHTALVPVAYLSGVKIVRDAILNEDLSAFLSEIIQNEILPSLDLEIKEIEDYAYTIIDRFSNPYIDHYLMDIALNSFSKFKSRLLPSLKNYYEKTGEIPAYISFSFACMILFYKGTIGDQQINLRDEKIVLDKMKKFWSKEKGDKIELKSILEWSEFWDCDLVETYPRLENMMEGYLADIKRYGIEKTLSALLKKG
jgi:tagaturonate reductase